ncbi:hypothetical protein [Magnetospira sp. QH-2]|uniref:hypothetical protein n=1 Tax=Magnetospira sp. (strain QH-2) TaxID=1288970 RepID=UPI0003E81064|nr:hypothetical protein [Magnetospira sp. QH-2]CCQ74760.1 protein of unknown function [Magnetospira sp. QH-2]
MAPPKPEEIQAIRDKPVAERTHADQRRLHWAEDYWTNEDIQTETTAFYKLNSEVGAPTGHATGHAPFGADSARTEDARINRQRADHVIKRLGPDADPDHVRMVEAHYGVGKPKPDGDFQKVIDTGEHILTVEQAPKPDPETYGSIGGDLTDQAVSIGQFADRTLADGVGIDPYGSDINDQKVQEIEESGPSNEESHRDPKQPSPFDVVLSRQGEKQKWSPLKTAIMQKTYRQKTSGLSSTEQERVLRSMGSRTEKSGARSEAHTKSSPDIMWDHETPTMLEELNEQIGGGAEPAAYRQERPLDVYGLRDTTIGPLQHDGFLYDNGDDSGYYDNSEVRKDKADADVIEKYENVGPHLEDDLLKQAEKNLESEWDQKTNPDAEDYNFFWRNCQDYADAVEREYYRLKAERDGAWMHYDMDQGYVAP